ncbi:MAG: Hpt domain-containing protein [Saprospiraceae bacterium]|nr:Hpt domain-containing protein [Saprospiraceae bacterium]
MIDTSLLKELFDNDDMILKYLKLFAQEVPVSFSRLKDNLENGNLKDVTIEAHSLKSQLNYLNATDSAAIALEIEQLSDKNCPSDKEIIVNKMNALEILLDKIILEINELPMKINEA